MSFNSLGLSTELVRAVLEKGYTIPTPIQLQSIPIILKGLDIMGKAQTGTGKTAGFTLPLLHLLNKHPKNSGRRAPLALILTPTRELAAQVAGSVDIYGKYLSLKSAIVFGGVNINPQIAKLRSGIDILIATPGRLLDHANQKTVDLSKIEILVLDEADRMLDMGFIHDVKKIINFLPKKRQTLLFSATLSKDIMQLTGSLQNSPIMIEVANHHIESEQVEQLIHPVDRKRKSELLTHLINSKKWPQVLVFTRTKHGANRLAEHLNKNKINAAAIHGNKSQGARTLALSQFKNKSVRVLVATDIAARGLDIDQLPHVVNFELPNVAEDYVHRIGRTGRAGYQGEAISLVCIDELKLLKDIEHLLKRELPKAIIQGYEPDPSIKAEPIINGRNGSTSHGGKKQFSGNVKKYQSFGFERTSPKASMSRNKFNSAGRNK
ncbi:MAG: DEAD/DEAH box helicase [Parachlamydiales bacterium]|jgi:ATP-dependent RNA helicase RhlE